MTYRFFCLKLARTELKSGFLGGYLLNKTICTFRSRASTKAGISRARTFLTFGNVPFTCFLKFQSGLYGTSHQASSQSASREKRFFLGAALALSGLPLPGSTSEPAEAQIMVRRCVSKKEACSAKQVEDISRDAVVVVGGGWVCTWESWQRHVNCNSPYIPDPRTVGIVDCQ